MKRYIRKNFEQFSELVSNNLGHPYAFTLACFVVLVWACCGPYFDYSDTWQLVINTGTTICTFLMVFLLQNTGNRTIEEMQDLLRDMDRNNRELHDDLKDMQNSLSDLQKMVDDLHERK
jgi:low affinity Fe/Cu permease